MEHIEKFLKSSLVLLCFVSGLTYCKREIDPNIDPLQDGTLRIVSIAFPSLEDNSIVIDQKNHLVRVKLPALLPKQMIPKIVLTPNASIWGGMTNVRENYSNGLGFFLADSVFLPLVKRDDTLSTNPVVTYYFIPEATGPLTMGEVTHPLDYELYNDNNDAIWIPFSNLYGNKIPASFILKNRATGQEFSLKKEAMLKGVDQMTNHLGVYPNRISTLVPGTYDLIILDSQGKIFKVPQPVNVKIGPAYLEYSRIYFGHEVAAGANLNLHGYNLFEGHIALDLTDNTGKTVKLNNLVFENTGHHIIVPISSNLKPGQYILRMFQDGKWNELCYRVNIFKDEKKVSFIGTIGDTFAPCTLLKPIKIVKQKETFFTYTQIEAGTPRLKLVSKADNKEVFYGKVKPHTGGVDPPTVTLPKQVKLGLYTAYLEIIDDSGKLVSESIPCSQLINVIE